tara:strand:- start:8735 stop:8896 length:162 start_codon:yes stop_codon:yes gene_type:complete
MPKTKSIIYDDKDWPHKTHEELGPLVDASVTANEARCATSLVKKPGKNWKGKK